MGIWDMEDPCGTEPPAVAGVVSVRHWAKTATCFICRAYDAADAYTLTSERGVSWDVYDCRSCGASGHIGEFVA